MEAIRAEENFRLAVQRELRPGGGKGWRDGVFFPALVVGITALASGLLVPYVFKRYEEQAVVRRERSRLALEVVSSSVEAQITLGRYQEQLCDYWGNVLRLFHQKALLAVEERRAGPNGDFRNRLEAIDTGIQREHSLRIQADSELAAARRAFTTAIERLSLEMQLYSDDAASVESYALRSKESYGEVFEWLNDEAQEALASAVRDCRLDLTECSSPEDCELLVKKAEAAIEEVCLKDLAFDEWNRARERIARQLVLDE